MYTLVYSIDNEKNPETLYINLTNGCTNNCIFCLRNQKDDVCGLDMWHDDNYNLEDIIQQFEEYEFKPKNVVFCGYGEPFLRKEMMKAFAKYVREKYPEITIRVNTNGHANAIYKTNVIKEFAGLLDEVSVSLNSNNEDQYNEICNPKIKNAFNEVQQFLKDCRNIGIKTIASVVTEFDDKHHIDVRKCERLALNLGAEFRERKFIKNGY